MTVPDQTIRFNVPSVEGRELEYVGEAITSGHTSSSGAFTKRAQELLMAETHAKEVLMTTSCTSALEMSAMLLDLGPDDTVIVPSFTFTSSALAFARQGAKILFCDIEPVTLGIDPKHLAELLDDSVKAVVIVHYAGIPCDVAGVREALADRPDVVVVEDAAHGLFGSWHGQPMGSLGRFASLSFHETKNVICGEGGALLLNDERDIKRARVLYDKGTDRMAFFLGQVDKYSWRDNGSSFGLSDVLAAYLVGQLEQAKVIQGKRKQVFERYLEGLAPLVERGAQLPHVPDDVDPAYHLFFVLLPDAERRPEIMGALKDRGINTTFHYVPLHNSEGGRRFALRDTDCPVTIEVSSRLIRLPFYNNLTETDQDRVIEALLELV
jgi:dTDP-4-amino-4,6-dideoxygalactose transaminase